MKLGRVLGKKFECRGSLRRVDGVTLKSKACGHGRGRVLKNHARGKDSVGILRGLPESGG